MIGAMRHLLNIQEEVLTPAAGGSFTRTWQNLVNTPAVYAEIIAASGGTTTDQRRDVATATFRLRIYYRRDIAAGMRLVGADKTYTIRHVADPRRHRALFGYYRRGTQHLTAFTGKDGAV